MIQYRIKRFSEEKKSHALRNTLIGAGALTAGVMAGRAGMLGTGVQKTIGTGISKVGNMVGSQKMINSGAKTVGQSAKTSTINNYMRSAVDGGANINKKALEMTGDMAAKQAETGILDRFKLQN